MMDEKNYGLDDNLFYKITFMEEFWKHLQTCNTMQDWSEAEQAMADTPNEFMDESYYEALLEIDEKKKKCTCGMEKALKETKEAMFTPEEIAKVQELAYEAGFNAGSGIAN